MTNTETVQLSSLDPGDVVTYDGHDYEIVGFRAPRDRFEVGAVVTLRDMTDGVTFEASASETWTARF